MSEGNEVSDQLTNRTTERPSDWNPSLSDEANAAFDEWRHFNALQVEAESELDRVRSRANAAHRRWRELGRKEGWHK